jgi:hypothetical protein
MINSNEYKCRCENGECIKYLNDDKISCRCNSGWSCIWCNIRSSDSISNRLICICPINKFVSRCLLKARCSKDYCLNNGQCIVLIFR